MRRNLLISLAALGLALLAGSGIAQADEGISFGIRPAKAYKGNPESFSYFTHSLAPGGVLADDALVMNNGDVPVSLELYAADGVTAINGGTAFQSNGDEASDVAHWLSLPVGEVSLAPGEERNVPFTINVPADASPGEHVAGLVAEAPPTGEAPLSGEGETQFAATVVHRAGVAVVIDVPGLRIAGLEITGVRMKDQSDEGAAFEVAVRNTGNILLRGEGFLVIKDREGTELASIPMEMDTVLPQDDTLFYVYHPVRLADGNYLLDATLRYRAVLGDEEGETALMQDVELKVKDGQPAVSRESMPPQAPPDVTTLTPASEEGGPPIGRYAAYGAALLALAAVATATIVRLRTRGRQPRQ